jgi:hypothetical protein
MTGGTRTLITTEVSDSDPAKYFASESESESLLVKHPFALLLLFYTYFNLVTPLSPLSSLFLLLLQLFIFFTFPLSNFVLPK